MESMPVILLFDIMRIMVSQDLLTCEPDHARNVIPSKFKQEKMLGTLALAWSPVLRDWCRNITLRLRPVGAVEETLSQKKKNGKGGRSE